MSQELKNTLDQLNRTFEEFKAKNDQALAEIKAKGTADAVTAATIDKLNARIAELAGVQDRLEAIENAGVRPALGPDGKAVSADVGAHAQAFKGYMQNGADTGLGDLAVKAGIRTSDDTDGGFAVPNEVDQAIQQNLLLLSPMRQICDVRTVGRGYSEIVDKGGLASGWVDEEDSRSETNTSKLAELKPFWGEIYANPGITQTALDDTFFDAAEWLSSGTELEFGLQEGIASVSGNGVKKMKGFLAYGTAATADATRTFQVLQHIVSGQAAALPTTLDPFIDMQSALNSMLKTGAVWVMNSITEGGIRKLKDSEGRYQWQPSNQEGKPNSFLGHGVRILEAMPDVAASALPVAFGNFKIGYRITDMRFGVRVLRDPYTNKPKVHFYTTKRVGGYLRQDKAIKVLKIST